MDLGTDLAVTIYLPGEPLRNIVWGG